MTNGLERKKKPPVLISELESRKEPPQKGPLTYVSQKDNPGSPENPGGGGKTSQPEKRKVNLTQIALAVGLSILIFVLISNFWLTPKKDATTLLSNQQILESKQNSLQAKVDTDSTRIENIMNNYAAKSELSGYATTASLAGYATTSQLQALSSPMADFLSKVPGYDSRIVALETKVNNLTSGNTTAGGVSGLSYYLTATTTGYKLHVTSNRDGIYVSRLTFIYNTPVTLVAASYSEAIQAFNSLVGSGRNFVGNIVLSGIDWKVTDFSFYTKSFELVKGDSTTETINVAVLDTSHPYKVYVEVLPGTVLESEDEEEGI